MATVAELQARKDEILLTLLPALDNLIDGSEEGTSISASATRSSLMMQLKELDRQIASIRMSEAPVTWLGSDLEDQYIEEGP